MSAEIKKGRMVLSVLALACGVIRCDGGEKPFRAAEAIENGGDKRAAAAAYDLVCSTDAKSKFCTEARKRSEHLKAEHARQVEEEDILRREEEARRREEEERRRLEQESEEKRRKEARARIEKEVEQARDEFPASLEVATNSGLSVESIKLKEVGITDDGAVAAVYEMSAFGVGLYRSNGGRMRDVILRAIFNDLTQPVFKKHAAWPEFRVRLVTEYADKDKWGNTTGSHFETIGTVTVSGDAVRNVNMDTFSNKGTFNGWDAAYDWLASFTTSVEMARN